MRQITLRRLLQAGATLDAACSAGDLDPEWWFSPEREAVRVAVRVCRGCRHRLLCAEAAIAAGEEHGVWGGTTPREREAIRSRRLALAAALDAERAAGPVGVPA
jgi:hypothetical protein